MKRKGRQAARPDGAAVQAVRRFDDLAGRYFRSAYRAAPTEATDLGIHDYDDQLDDVGRSALRARARRLRESRARFEEIDPGQLPTSAAIDRELILSDIDGNLLSLEQRQDWARDPSYYLTAPLFSIFLLASRDFAPRRERIHNMTARLKALPDVLAAGRANLEDPPRILTEIAIEEAQGGIEFCDSLIPRLSAQPAGVPANLRVAIGRARQALDEYLRFLRHDLLLVSRGPIGIGKTNFEAMLVQEHLLPYSVEQLLDAGQRAFEETRRELAAWAKRIDPERSWREIVEQARNEHPSPSRLLAAYRKEIERLRVFTQDHDLVGLPAEECEVVETPPFDRALNSFAAYVGPAPFDVDQRGQFWVTPIDTRASRAAQREQMQEHCNYLYPITAAHEAYPGHHVQLVRANQAGSRWRKHFSSSLFAEGWALYCEELMDRSGYYRDARTKLFQLKDRLWRAARVSIEIGIHCYEMSLNEAASFLVAHLGMTPTMARAETHRYAAEPTQPMSYLIGELEVFRLYDKFAGLSLREFHDLLLDSGTIPFSLVEREMEEKTKPRT